ncbi:MAG: DUF4346 domain-containing protein [Candidatus Woesearchaeota archaeon]
MTFPKSPHLAVGEGKQIGILTLWTKKEHVMAQVPSSLYAVCAQLYSRDEGISNLLRSLLAHKEIRDIILVGADLNLCAPTLLALFAQGVDERHQVVGAPGYIDPELPREAIDRVRKHVTVHDLQSVKEYAEVAEYIKTIPKKPSWGEPEEFAKASISPPKTFPHPPQHSLIHPSLSDALIELARRHERFHTLTNVTITIGSYPYEEEHEFRYYEQLEFSDVENFVIPEEKIVTIGIEELLPTKEISAYTKKRFSRYQQGDGASNVLIRLHDEQINITHLSPAGKRLEVFSDTSAQRLYKKLVEEFRVSDLSHAAYLGFELARAENALKSGSLYEQDQP